jgi:hypothetical protein
MADLRLDIVVIPTYNIYNMAVVDSSTYPTDPPAPDTPWIHIEIPGFNDYDGAFIPAETNVYNSTTLGITTAGNECALPDGIYYIKYTNNPAYLHYVEKSILRVDKLQQKFDEAFMQLDMMECDRAIKTQAKVDLNTIYFFIQGAIAAANNCATVQSTKLYAQANNMLDSMINGNCGCSGINYMINFQ